MALGLPLMVLSNRGGSWAAQVQSGQHVQTRMLSHFTSTFPPCFLDLSRLISENTWVLLSHHSTRGGALWVPERELPCKTPKDTNHVIDAILLKRLTTVCNGLCSPKNIFLKCLRSGFCNYGGAETGTSQLHRAVTPLNHSREQGEVQIQSKNSQTTGRS